MDDAAYDTVAEQCVLGALLLGDSLAFGTVTGLISSRDFYHERHQRTFEAITRVSKRGEKVDLLTLRDELIRQGIFEQFGGFAFLVGLFDKLPTTLQVADYAETVRLCALWRGR